MENATDTENTRAPQRPPNTQPAQRTRPHRIAGLDFARFVALIGMMVAHVWTMSPDGSTSLPTQIVSGKAAALFAVLAGVGITLTSRRFLEAGRPGAARLNLVGRGAALIVIGLTLGLLPTPVVVILVYYGVMFWAAIPFIRASVPVLLSTAALLAVVWPPISSWLRSGLEQPFELGSASWLSLADPAAFGRGLFLTGEYPVPTWIVYALIGMAVGRLVLRAADAAALRRLGIRLVAIGGVLSAALWGISALLAGPLGGLAALSAERSDLDPGVIPTLFYGTGFGAAPSGSPWWLISPAPHSGTLVDLGITAGLALVVIGALLALGTGIGERTARILEPVRRAGAAPLTVYSAHVTATGIVYLVAMIVGGIGGAVMPWYISSGWLWMLHAVGAVAIGALLSALNRRGPLETLVTWSGQRSARLAPGYRDESASAKRSVASISAERMPGSSKE